MARDLHAEVDSTFDEALTHLRGYGDAILAESDRRERLDRLQGKAEEAARADYSARFAALRERS